MAVDWISFSWDELEVLCVLLGLPPLVPPTGADATAVLQRLRERGAVHATEPEVAIPVAELLLLVARPIVDIDIRFAGPSRAPGERIVQLRGNGRAIVQTAPHGDSVRFIPFAAVDLLPRLADVCGLDMRPRPDGDGFTASLAVLDACKDAAESGGVSAARDALVDGGVDTRDAGAFAGALTNFEQTVAVRVAIRVGRIRQGVELFWLDAPGARWALPSILSPFAASSAEAPGVASHEEGEAHWTVDPSTTALTVAPTDGEELLAAVQATLTRVGSGSG